MLSYLSLQVEHHEEQSEVGNAHEAYHSEAPHELRGQVQPVSCFDELHMRTVIWAAVTARHSNASSRAPLAVYAL